MRRFQADRVQHPIGQGGFHSIALHTPPRSIFSMVVDCGGSNKAHRTMLAEAFAEGKSDHDFLAISHLDDDHINGLEELKNAGVTFRTVFLPHVDPSLYLKWMTLRVCGEYTENAAATINSFAMTSAGLYSGRYGQVVRVGKPNPERNTDDPGAPHSEANIDQIDPRSPLTIETQRAISEAKQKGGAGLSSSTSLTFDLDWLIRFYSLEWSYPKEVSDIWSIAALQGLKTVIDSISPNFTASDWENFTFSLSAELKKKVDPAHWPPAPLTVGATKGWTSLATDVLGGKLSCKALLSRLYKLSSSLHDYNDASMCVYSGPSDRGITSPRSQFVRLQDTSVLKKPLTNGTVTRGVGWIHTGDVGLETESKLHAFVQHYSTELPLTTVMVLPHHGSRMSFDAKMATLQDLCACLARPTVFLAPAEPGGSNHHPHAEVSCVCQRAGELLVVDETAGSRYSESALSPTYAWW